MGDELDLSAVATARQLLTALREIKDDYREVDAAVWKHLTGGRGHTVGDVARKHVSEYAARLSIKASLNWIIFAAAGFVPGFSPLARLVAVTGGLLSGEALTVPRARKDYVADAAIASEFLAAGVRVELALDSLAFAIRDAHRGEPGAAPALLAQSHHAQQAFDRYEAAGQSLDESKIDIDVHFGWTGLDFDLGGARTVLDANAGAVLDQVRHLATEATIGEIAPHSSARTAVAGGLNALIAAAVAIRKDLAAARGLLDTVETTLRQDESAHQARHATDEAQLYLNLTDADCLLIENAARSGAHADASRAVAHLKEAATTQTVVAAFDGYATGVASALVRLGATSNPHATAIVERLHVELPRMRHDVEALAATARAEFEHLGEVAMS